MTCSKTRTQRCHLMEEHRHCRGINQHQTGSSSQKHSLKMQTQLQSYDDISRYESRRVIICHLQGKLRIQQAYIVQ